MQNHQGANTSPLQKQNLPSLAMHHLPKTPIWIHPKPNISLLLHALMQRLLMMLMLHVFGRLIAVWEQGVGTVLLHLDGFLLVAAVGL
jgi:hypothetical protein